LVAIITPAFLYAHTSSRRDAAQASGWYFKAAAFFR